jgi:hypothetical protein
MSSCHDINKEIVMAAPQPTVIPPGPEEPRTKASNLGVWIVSIALLGVTALGGVVPTSGLAWLVVLLSMFVFVLFLGKWICGRPLGILVTDRNLMSLSRFQMILWTLLILSGYLTIAMKRIHGGIPNPLDFGIDTKLWALMGISTASLVGSPLLLQSKKLQQPAANSVEKASTLLKENQETIQDNSQGRLYANASPLDARFTDIFQGDEIGNTAYLDPAKLQMFFFSLIVACSFAYQMFASIHGAAASLAMPVFSDGMVALLGISHAGYLGSKTVN